MIVHNLSNNNDKDLFACILPSQKGKRKRQNPMLIPPLGNSVEWKIS
jgi:hypothetical protein